MALARVQYVQQMAGNKNFTVPFPYISRDHVFVSVNGTDVDFSWLNSTTVQLTTAPAEGDLVDIRRETERINLLVDFQDASTITEEQLDLSAKQAFFIAQEAFDATGATLAVTNDGSYSANNRKLSNVADPTNDTDAATQGWVKAQYQSGKDAHQERLAAEAARDAAAASQTAAAISEANALSYRNTANSHRIEAANSAAAAAASATNAANSAAAAKASEADVAANAAAAQAAATAAANSEANALSYKNSAASSASAAGSYAASANDSSAKASLWAEAAEDSAVEPGKYSAKHHAAKAAASAASASMSATNAANYRDTANSHRQAAANSAAQAASSATAASNSASAAATSATNAAASAAVAAGYAAGVNLPSALGHGGKYLRQRVDESGLEYRTSEQMRADLGLGTAATRYVTTSPTDTTAGRVLTVGDFGVGATIWIPAGANLNDYTTPGEYFQYTNANANPELNYPAQLAGSLKVIKSTTNGCVQEYTTFGSTRRKFLRGLNGGVWSSWVEFYHTGNLADAFKGANQSLSSNGYQKLPGGLIIQWFTWKDDGQHNNRTFPITFPNACLAVVCQERYTGDKVATSLITVNSYTSSYVRTGWSGAGASGWHVIAIAIGY